MGMLADRLGRKAILIPSLLLFGLAGGFCAFQESFELLLVFRFFQGIGASALGTLNVTLIGDLFKGEQRAAAMGYNASVLSIGVASFPAIGGFIADVHWQYVFLLPLLTIPLGIILYFGLKSVPIPEKQPLKLYLSKVWKVVNQKQVWGLFIFNVLLFLILYGTLLSFFPLLMNERFNASPSKIGLFMTLMSLTTALSSAQLGKLRKRYSNITLFLLSSLLYLVALLMIGAGSHYALIIPGMVIFGAGHGLLIPNIQTTLVGYAQPSERAAFMSINSMVIRIGQSLGPMLVGLFYFWQDISLVFYLSAIIPVVMIGIIVTMVRK
jgi:MFS family permease